MESVKPLLIYDGDCSFCKRWVLYWQSLADNRIDIAPSQEVAAQFPQINPADFQKSVQFVEPNGKIYKGAEAVFRSLNCGERFGKGGWLWLYEHAPGFRPLTEWFYKLVAEHRITFSHLTNLLWGKYLERSTYFITRWIFLRFMAVIYLVAFVSLGTQILGLLGSEGILPAKHFLEAVAKQVGPERFWALPTLAWLSASDGFLQFLCWGGALLSVLALFNLAPALIFFLLWIFYLSLFSIGQDFLSFQWDILLLEVGFLAIFFSPLQIIPRLSKAAIPSRAILWLLRLLLFRLTFSSGMVKLLSGDPAWRNFTALKFHYETQPLPIWTSWFMHQLPDWFQKMSVFTMFGIELIAPLLIFAPRHLRFIGCVLLQLLQNLILGTGNYTFFNWLTIALTLTLLDDRYFANFWPFKKLVSKIKPAKIAWPRWVMVPLVGTILLLSMVVMTVTLRIRFPWPVPVAAVYGLLNPFRLVNGYGLFAVMTKERREIIVEGSNDGLTWKAYEFKYKPGSLSKKPNFVAPHQPRLDWQMWFAALGNYRQSPWFVNFCFRLLQGSPEILRLLKENPFPEHPPKYIRASFYDYHFTNLNERKETGEWWKRESQGLYLPPISLENLK